MGEGSIIIFNMNESNEMLEEENSISSFGDYRPQSEGNRTLELSANVINRTMSNSEIQVEEHKEDANNSSDTANFFQDTSMQNGYNPDDTQSLIVLHGNRYSSNSSSGERMGLPGAGSQNLALWAAEPGDIPSYDEGPRNGLEARIGEVADDILNSLNNENDRLTKIKIDLKRQKVKFDWHVTEEKQKLMMEKERWEENKKRAAKFSSQEIVELNVGGTHKLAISKATLCKAASSSLAAMFNGKHKLKMHEGQVFIDRDGDIFAKVLSYLRNDKVPLFEDKVDETLFYEELYYWAIPYNAAAADVMAFDPLWCAPSLRLEQGNTAVSKRSFQHGTVFCSRSFAAQRNYVEFKVCVSGHVRLQKANIFVGLVDREKHCPSQLLSTFWKDSPSSFYWDVWNCKLIKVNEDGIQSGMVGDYGCECRNEEVNTIGMLYDCKKKTVSFYKNGICLGIGFHNVPKNLYPAVDLWFEAGQVEIVNKSRPDIGE